ncbi:hypothetical protein H6H01_30710 [Nostoc calcicola FACHB-3891]|nr:hypothetical protein [Nostoc calcicola FACHB-3891]
MDIASFVRAQHCVPVQSIYVVYRRRHRTIVKKSLKQPGASLIHTTIHLYSA